MITLYYLKEMKILPGVRDPVHPLQGLPQQSQIHERYTISLVFIINLNLLNSGYLNFTESPN